MSRILSFDTSNYTTSVCLYDTQNGIIWDKRIMLEVTSGACGLRQNDAVFLHTKNLTDIFEDFIKSDIDYIAASNRPSEREHSYMPCFTVGVSFASALSKILDKPLFLCSHQKNHIAAAAYSGGCTNLIKHKFIAYHVSGGTTDIVLCEPDLGDFNVTKIGGTADISCGQLIDRTGTLLGYDFPCGKKIENNSFDELIGAIKIKSRDHLYNFSGFQNKVEQMHSVGYSDAQICTYVLDVVYSFLKDSVNKIRVEYGNLPVLFSGGVMSNKIISSHVKTMFDNIYFAKSYFSVDNALGTAYLCAFERGLAE